MNFDSSESIQLIVFTFHYCISSTHDVYQLLTNHTEGSLVYQDVDNYQIANIY